MVLYQNRKKNSLTDVLINAIQRMWQHKLSRTWGLKITQVPCI